MRRLWESRQAHVGDVIAALTYRAGLHLAALWKRIVGWPDRAPASSVPSTVRAREVPARGRAPWVDFALAVCLAVWGIAAVAGAFSLLSHLPQRIADARTNEVILRQSTWSPIYGFAQACAPRIQAGAGILLLDPTARTLTADPATRTGPAAFGDPNDVDWPNQAAFTYAVYPHQVTALGHLPGDQATLLGQGGYVAVWQQVDYRSSEARAGAATAADALQASPQLVEVCAYSDGQGDRGSILAPAALASAGGLDPPDTLGHGTFKSYAATFLGLACLWVIGAALLRVTCARMNLLLVAGALPLGCLAMCLEMLAFSVVRVHWSPTPLLLPWLPLAAVAVWKAQAGLPRPVSLRAPLAGLGQRWRGLDRTERLALVALASLFALVAAAATLALPDSDGFNLYYFKARAFFVDGSVIPYYTSAGRLLFSFPAHPPLVPLGVTWLYLVIGHVDEHATQLLWPALYLSLLVALYALVRAVVSRPTALWYTLAAAFVAYQITSSALGGGYTDMPLALFLLLGVGSLWTWAGSRRRPHDLVIQAGLFLGAAALTKEEGLVAALLLLTACLILTWRQDGLRAALRAVTLTGGMFVAVVILWLALRRAYHLPVLTVDLGARVGYVLSRLTPAVTGVGLRALPQLMLAMAVIAAAIVAARSFRLPMRASLSPRFWFVSTIVVALLGLDALAIAAAPVEVHYQVQVAATRLVSQVLPLTLLALAEPWRVVWIRR